jgi:hypothetical protein
MQDGALGHIRFSCTPNLIASRRKAISVIALIRHCAGILAVVAALQACSSPPYAAESNRCLDAQELPADRILSADDQSKALASFDAVTTGAKSVNTPGPARHGVRWSDLAIAVAYACDDVEMAVVREIEHDWGAEFVLRTINDEPGVLTVRRMDDANRYEAEAVIGFFKDRRDQAAALIKALDRHWREFGRKRSLKE